MLDTVKLIALGAIAVLAAIAANYARPDDPAYLVNALIVMLVAGVMFIRVLRQTGNAQPSLDPAPQTEYLDSVVRAGVTATAFWGVVGFLVGVVIAFQLAFPALNLSDYTMGYTNFGKLRPLHTSAVIFAFGGNALIATSFYVVQRTSAARLWGGNAAWFVFWGYNLFIVLAATGYILGATQSKEYAEPEWYVDWWLTVVWVVYLAVFLGTILKRKEPHIYVANWFYLSFIVTIAMLHIVNNLSVPVSFLGSKSVQVFSGVQDGMVQWWYGHNAVGFFLTAGFLGMMYYFIPKQAERRERDLRDIMKKGKRPIVLVVDEAHDLADELRRGISGLHNLNLQRCDRVTMAHGLEARVPFLDRDLVNLAGRIPIEWRLPGELGQEKALLREAFTGWLPDDLLWRPKEQFGDGSGTADVMTERAAHLVPEDDWADERVAGLPAPRTREELAYQRMFATRLAGVNSHVLGRFATA